MAANFFPDSKSVYCLFSSSFWNEVYFNNRRVAAEGQSVAGDEGGFAGISASGDWTTVGYDVLNDKSQMKYIGNVNRACIAKISILLGVGGWSRYGCSVIYT